MASLQGIRLIPAKPGKWLTILAFFILAVVLSLLIRNPVLKIIVDAKRQAFNREFNADLKITGIAFRGIASVEATGISLLPAGGDTLLKVDTAYASVGILKLLAGRIALHDVRLIHAILVAETRDSGSNYDFLIHRKESRNRDTTGSPVNYAATADRLMEFAFDKIPLALQIRDLQLVARKQGYEVAFRIGKFDLADHYFRTRVEVAEMGQTARWNMAGRLDNSRRMAEFRLWPADSASLYLPFLEHRWKACVSFDTLAFSVAEREVAGDRTRIAGYMTIRGLVIDHPMIAAVPVRFEKTGIRYLLNFGPDFAELDSATGVDFNRIDLHPYLRFQPGPPAQITLRVHKPRFPAGDLFSSFPEGLFTSLDGIRVKGDLSWNLDFSVDLSKPDSLEFSTALDRHQFAVLSFGNANLTRINEPFEYTACDRGEPVRTFTVGPGNPGFHPLTRIPLHLRYAVMTSEDGAFYEHRGFLPEAFRESVVENIKQRRFARGGSTITMQLVKNVFLSRNKTIARKMEEALLVWLIENQGLSTKDRMFEVYLNIIEWGPRIYGAGEASRFYFGKDVSKLTLAEAIYLASIIPRPKGFRFSFDTSGHLRDFNAEFYRLVSEKMLRKGWITPEEAAGLVPDVTLKGPARLLLKTDPVPADSLPVPVD